MNIKVIIVWVFAIVILAGIGVFGYVNQDLLVEQDDGIYTPGDIGAQNYYCTKAFENADSSYTFEVNQETNQISRVIMTYNSKVADLDAYTAAETIRDAGINGIITNLSGTVSSFMFMVTVDLATYDKATVEFYTNEFQRLSMIIDSVTDYNTYVTALNGSQAGTLYTCA